MSKSKLFLRISLILAIISCSFYAYKLINPTIVLIQGSSVINASDDRELSGFANNIFVGKVVTRISSKKLLPIPETQFKVQVLDNIKGELKGNVTVRQLGGQDGTKLYLHHGDALLEPGKTYLFATRFLESEKWHSVVPVYGDVEIKNNVELSNITERFKKAHKNEIPYDADKMPINKNNN